MGRYFVAWVLFAAASALFGYLTHWWEGLLLYIVVVLGLKFHSEGIRLKRLNVELAYKKFEKRKKDFVSNLNIPPGTN